MRKQLLLSLMALCMALSGFALSPNEFVYTPQGRFLITSTNMNANNSFKDFTGWTVITSTEGKNLQDNYILNTNGYAEGINSMQSIDATAGEGMYYKFEPASSGETYVVSFKMRGSVGISTRIKTNALSTNLVRVMGNTDGGYGGETDVVYANKGEELSEEWQTFYYAIVPDGIARTFFISFTGMSTNVEIADLQIASAVQVADLRQRNLMLEKINVYKNCHAWSEDVLTEYGISETIEVLEAIGDEYSQNELDEAMATAQEVLDCFLKENMEDYFATNPDNHFVTASKTYSKASVIADWNCLPTGRTDWKTTDKNGPGFGNFQNSSSWNYNNPTSAMGAYMQKELTVGSYVFSIEGRGAIREAAKNSYEIDEGMKPAYSVAYIKKVPAEGAEPTDADTIIAIVKDLDPILFTGSILPVKITEEGQYEIGMKVYCKEAYQSKKCGSIVYLKNASLWGKNDNKYSQAQLAYYDNVMAQITTGRNQLTIAADNIASVDNTWGKGDLKAVADEVEPKIAAYEAMDQDAIIATFDAGTYEAGPANENGLMEHEVYDSATRLIIAANRTFAAINDTLNFIQDAIDVAEATLTKRVYDAATGKDALTAAINTARDVLTKMRALEYSEENVATVKEAVATLNEATETFKKSIPANAIATVIAVDFENGAKFNEDTQTYETIGTNTVMTYSKFSETTPATASELPFELGVYSNGEKLLPGVLRVGNGTATAEIPARNYGTNIVKVSMDWWFVSLTKCKVGFYLKNENEVNVAGWYFEPYNSTIAANYDSFALNPQGDFYTAKGTDNAAACTDENKTHIEFFLDYGEKSMYLESTTPKGTFTSDKVEFNCETPASFVVQSGYNTWNGRRCWFDNLKIEEITAGATEPFTEVIQTAIPAVNPNSAAIYNLQGVRVTNTMQKGIYISNGKKIVVR